MVWFLLVSIGIIWCLVCLLVWLVVFLWLVLFIFWFGLRRSVRVL